ncbi:SDR family oxidoreductase [Ilyobacter polytropus]|uniref:Short-chain dehydrogenase/reductase SDR n=1 Tax=Ilyobacter polytropus (strain ATCC 51220 / DSM 2926 / LMG 16218 / CuHBu1) TaxID=572544 RepID=E3HE44_ILYPC|nr:SDR family oxidoreductase [Ilyobacter polytropus]ADO84656.1 short-chain dehydrogenase/reductase SDR [Ilyobacter polytropus DSM 2926]
MNNINDIQKFSMDFFSLKGKNALITGGNTGLGQAFALALAKAGANIFIPSIMDDDGETKKLIEAEGVKMEFMMADITKEGMPKKIIERCVETLGSIDILVNSAGICKIAEVKDFARNEWDPMISVNLTAAFELSHEAAKYMIPQNNGKIINICSMFSFLGGQWSPAYAATKHGIAGFTKAYCDELAQYNIQVNGIAPGYYATDITLKTRSNPETNKKVLDHIPANRWGETMDLMGATVFLASNASNYVNGHVLAVDGGYLVR